MMNDEDIKEFHNIGHEIIWNKKYDYKAPSRVDGPDGRKYLVNGEKLPSVTTILGKTRTPEKRREFGEMEAESWRN